MPIWLLLIVIGVYVTIGLAVSLRASDELSEADKNDGFTASGLIIVCTALWPAIVPYCIIKLCERKLK